MKYLMLLAGLCASAQAEQVCLRNQSALVILDKQVATTQPVESVALTGAVYARGGLTIQPTFGAGVRRGNFWIFDVKGVPGLKLDMGFNPVFPPHWVRDVGCAL